MKKLILLITIVMLSLTAFSQVGTDTSKIKCFPVSVAKMIAKDLLKGDSAMAELNLANEQITELNKKIFWKDSLIANYQKKDSNYLKMLDLGDRKYSLLEKSNKDLQDKLIKEKFKLKRNTWISAGVAVLTSLLVVLFK